MDDSWEGNALPGICAQCKDCGGAWGFWGAVLGSGSSCGPFSVQRPPRMVHRGTHGVWSARVSLLVRTNAGRVRGSPRRLLSGAMLFSMLVAKIMRLESRTGFRDP